jgi:hypothetical protein
VGIFDSLLALASSTLVLCDWTNAQPIAKKLAGERMIVLQLLSKEATSNPRWSPKTQFSGRFLSVFEVNYEAPLGTTSAVSGNIEKSKSIDS